MARSFAKLASGTMDSFIMSLVDVAARPGMISFSTGLPDNSLFDIEGLAKASDEVLREMRGDALQYDSATGYIPLRKRIAERCRKELGFDATYEDVIMTNGSQECFDLLARLFLDPGDRMAVENPGYLGAIQSFSAYAPEFIGIDVGPEGADADQLARAVESGAKLFYSIPNHQNPSGNSYSESVRRSVADIVRGSRCLLIEDDAYGELGYAGRAGRTMKSMAPEDTVLTGSFSKTISPGMRIGWMVVPEWMRAQAGRSLEAMSLQSGTLCQKIVDRFLQEHDYDEYLRGLRKSYSKKKDFFLDIMEDELPDCMEWNNPKGGMFVWLTSPEGTDAMRIFNAALDRKLVVMPGKPFHVRGGENTLRLNFATPTEDQIRAGMKALGDACRDVLGI
ncbi:MAG: PLP-dependent aminotransferase family protein [Candidatus Methanomethylophilaceae archaeon]|jgi:2-aminoadipate transaminase|nr:PLP-dependent aminotransferase family protein [Candidatus Methanomethylophilaceae archaeon]